MERQVEICDNKFRLSYDELKAQDWGYVYEKFIGQIFEDEGYKVSYNGLERGLIDRGIDLIAEKENLLNFIQCKFVKQRLSKSRIDWILYKASGLLHEKHKHYNGRIIFTLIVNKKEDAFSKTKRKDFRLTFSDVSKVEYPMLQYFLDHNHIQNRVKLEFREIEMNK